MRDSTVYDCTLLRLPRVEADGGIITSLNSGSDLAFEIQRVYYLYDVPAGAVRGGHAHKELRQLIVAGSGSFAVVLHDGSKRRAVSLNRPDVGLLIVPGIWRELEEFSSGSVCLVLASEPYRESDYIRDFAAFCAAKHAGGSDKMN